MEIYLGGLVKSSWRGWFEEVRQEISGRGGGFYSGDPKSTAQPTFARDPWRPRPPLRPKSATDGILPKCEARLPMGGEWARLTARVFLAAELEGGGQNRWRRAVAADELGCVRAETSLPQAEMSSCQGFPTNTGQRQGDRTTCVSVGWVAYFFEPFKKIEGFAGFDVSVRAFFLTQPVNERLLYRSSGYKGSARDALSAPCRSSNAKLWGIRTSCNIQFSFHLHNGFPLFLHF